MHLLELKADPEHRLKVGHPLIGCPSFGGLPCELVLPFKDMMHLGDPLDFCFGLGQAAVEFPG